jgi:hypothetical protein
MPSKCELVHNRAHSFQNGAGLPSRVPELLIFSVIADLRPDYRCADKVRRRMRRRVRSRVFTSARTATRTFDLQLAIAHPPSTRPSLMSRLVRIRTIPVVYGGNRAVQRRISKRVNAAIDLLVSGDVKTIKEAAEKVGMARESLSRALSTAYIAEHLRTKVLKSLAMAAARAGAVKVDLLDSDNAIARDKASSFVLGLAGIQPATIPSVNLNIEMKAGFVIDLSEDDPLPMRTISP